MCNGTILCFHNGPLTKIEINLKTELCVAEMKKENRQETKRRRR